MEQAYLNDVKKQFSYYKKLGEQAMSQLPEEKLFWQFNEESNSIATIIKHLSGNMLSRWTDLLSSDGEKQWRNRDAEFINDVQNKEELMNYWDQGWKCLFDALDVLTTADLGKEIFIRNMGQTVMEAINRQLAHYPYHIGQMVFIAKMVCNTGWSSLTIPKANSAEYNAAKFDKPRHKENFMDEFLKNEKQ